METDRQGVRHISPEVRHFSISCPDAPESSVVIYPELLIASRLRLNPESTKGGPELATMGNEP